MNWVLHCVVCACVRVVFGNEADDHLLLLHCPDGGVNADGV